MVFKWKLLDIKVLKKIKKILFKQWKWCYKYLNTIKFNYFEIRKIGAYFLVFNVGYQNELLNINE